MRQKGFIHVLPLLVIAVAVLVVGGVTYRLTTGDKNLVKQQVLSSSEDSDSSGSDSSGSSGSGSSGLSDSGSSNSGKSDDGDKSGSSSSSSGSSSPTSTPKPEEQKTEITTDSGVQIKTETKTDGRVRTEIRFGEEEKIRTRVEEGRTRVDVFSGGVKVRLERRDDRVVISAEREDGTEVEVGEDELVQIKQRLGKINIATAGAKLALITNGIGTNVDFPIQIDLATNALTIVTPAGEKQVTILPDQAVQNLIAANVIDRLGVSSVLQVATSSATFGVSDVVQLGLQQNLPVYEIVGLRDERLLGIIPVTTTLRVTVSAQTGNVISTSQSLFDSVVDFLSF